MTSRDLSHFDALLFGGDYNPDQWPEDVWQDDMRLMREAGVNCVSLGIFSWSKLEPQPGQYDFGWLDRVMDLLHANGIWADLATATASPPAWMAHRYPQSLPVTREGLRLSFGSRQQYSPHSQVYKDYAAQLVEQLAERYKAHPALAMWHINNEYACHIAECFSDAGAQAFRVWLEHKYGTLDALNQAWGTAFWSQRYSDWAEVTPPRSAPTFVNPTLQLDWKRFSSDAILDLMKREEAILRRITPNVPITTNFMGFFKPLDYWEWAKHEDVVSDDAYPDPSSPVEQIFNAMRFDLMRSLGGGRPWILMEQSASAVNWRERNSRKQPGQMRVNSLQALARGARGILFFQWRQSKAGAEKFHAAMVPHAGGDSRIFREVTALGAELKSLAAMRETKVQAEAAIVFDWHSWWALELDAHPSADVKLIPLLVHHYRALYHRNIALDFAHPSQDLSRYKLVVVPNLYLMSDDVAANLGRYVSAGGTLLVSPFSGIVNQNDHVYLGGYPGPLREMLGVRIEEFAPMQLNERSEVVTRDEESFACQTWADVLRLEGAQGLAMFTKGSLDGQAAVTRHRFGQGTAFYAGTVLDEAGMSWLMNTVISAAQLQPVLDTPPGIEAVRRDKWLFLINTTDAPASVAVPGRGAVTLKPFDGWVGEVTA